MKLIKINCLLDNINNRIAWQTYTNKNIHTVVQLLESLRILIGNATWKEMKIINILT